MTTEFSDIILNIKDFLSYNPAEPMLFSSGTFWALFLIFLPLYALLKKRVWQMATFVVIFSFFFYYKSSGIFVCLLGGTSLLVLLILIFFVCLWCILCPPDLP